MNIKTTKEHYTKYANLCLLKGVDYRLPATKKEILEALNNGDLPLNTIKLIKWDSCARSVGWTSEHGGKRGKSLAEQVCFLKHIAIYHIAECTPDFA